MKILVATEHTADDRKSLAAVRALGKAGMHVTVGSNISSSPPLWSRYCRQRIRYPSPVDERQAFSEWAISNLESYGFDVILPLSDYTTAILASLKPILEKHVAIPVPDPPQMAIAHDKLALLERAKQLGIDIPQTHCPQSRDELEQVCQEISYPCVFKLRMGAGAIGLAFPSSAMELLSVYDNREQRTDNILNSDRPLMQEYIPGFVHDACMLFNNGELRAAITQKRLLMYPDGGGVGIYNETTDEPELLQQAEKLLRSLQWHGPAMVEFKLDSRDKRYKLMEINSRYWGTLDMAIQAGINFPLLASRMVTQGDIEPVTVYRVGMKYRWIWPHGLQYAIHSKHPWRSLLKFFRPHRHIRSDFWLSDPLPHLMHTRELFRSR